MLVDVVGDPTLESVFSTQDLADEKKSIAAVPSLPGLGGGVVDEAIIIAAADCADTAMDTPELTAPLDDRSIVDNSMDMPIDHDNVACFVK